MLVLAMMEHLTKLKLLPPFLPPETYRDLLDGHFLRHRTRPGSTSRYLSPFDDAERIPMSTYRKILRLGLDTLAVGLGLGYDALGELGLNASAVGHGLGLGATGELRIGLHVVVGGLSARLDVSSGPTLGLGSSIVPSQKRPQAVTHRIWVEEKPMDSADQVSYREAIVGVRLGRSGLMLLERSFDLCRYKNDLRLHLEQSQ